MLGFDMMVHSRFWVLFGPGFRTICFAAVLSAIVLSGAVSISRRHFKEVFVFTSFSLLIIVQMSAFSFNFNTELNPSAAIQFYPMLTFIVFSICIRQFGVRRVCEWFALYSTVYCFMYVSISACIYFGYLDQDLVSALTQTDAERGTRILISAPPALFAFFYSIYGATKSNYVKALMFLFSSVSIGVSLSRYLIVFFVLTCVILVVFKKKSSLSNLAIMLIFFVSSLPLLWGFVDSWWNPFAIFSSDSSGKIRLFSYDTAIGILQRHPLLGAGIPADDLTLMRAVSNYTFAPMDLGIMGVWFNFGLTGTFFYIYSVWIATLPRVQLLDMRAPEYQSIRACALVLAANACLTPSIWFTGCFFGLALAYYLMESDQYSSRTRAQSSRAASDQVGW
ncbi:O-antigen ligase family protein [Methylorubrum extorquens]|nr:O-antigen ligase family protein [Methylorubrum extorquens]